MRIHFLLNHKNATFYTRFFVVVFLLSMVLSSSVVQGKSDDAFVMVGLLENDELPRIKTVHAFRDTVFYTDYFFTGFPYETDLMLEAYDDNGELILEREVRSKRIILNYTPNLSRVVLKSPEQTLDERIVSFCDEDGVCEPCLTRECTMYENAAVCSDCSSGSDDGYCDLADDGICDPDCNGIDADCSDCDPCYYAYYNRERTLCAEDLRGIQCDLGEGCLNGTFVYSDDSGSRCCTGICVSKDRTQELLRSGVPVDASQNKTGQNFTDEKEPQQREQSFFMTALLVILVVSVLGAIGAGVLWYYENRTEKTGTDALDKEIITLRLNGHSDTQIIQILERDGYTREQIQKRLYQ